MLNVLNSFIADWVFAVIITTGTGVGVGVGVVGVVLVLVCLFDCYNFLS